ncbi:MAG: lipoyl(octanoyl) transferase LipB [Acidobacteria bacterium]|nr:lipoyl(octanoyl) transferase LipB [Acidobacteriota bacterium]
MHAPAPSLQPPAPRRQLHVRRLGVVPYGEALALQRALVEERKAGSIPDTLLLVQHPHVLTLGVKGDGGRGHILVPPDRLAALGVEVSETGRGGDVTYHGPGQLVAYPIIDLDPDRRDVHRYVRDLEEVMIRVCGSYGVTAGRISGKSGAWVRVPSAPAEPAASEASAPAASRPPEKIGALGVRISRWITSHGIALNVWTDLEYFQLIVPCGIAEYGVTSLEREIGVQIPMREVEAHFVQHFGDVFDRRPSSIDASPS